MSKLLRGYLLVIASAFIYGCMPLMTKLLYVDGISSLSVVLLRNALCLPALALLSWKQGASLRIPKKALPPIISIALIGGCATTFLLFSSYRYIPSGTATVFHFVYPAVVLVAGISLFYDPSQPMDLRGAAMALISGLTYAAYVLLLVSFPCKDMSGYKLCFYISLFSSIILLPACAISGQLTLPTTLRCWGLSLLLALTINAGAVLLFQQGTFLIGGERAAILSTVEPITSVLIGALVFQEHIGLRTAAGSALVILASILIAVFDLRRSGKAAIS